jgi:23S rRNA (uracil1939-C5)-methyltransferase
VALTLDVEITELSPGGDGVAHASIGGERRAIFAGGVLPGETVTLEVDPRSRPARGRLLRIVQASADRVVPACAHVDRCGGCDWMHLGPAAQAREHARIVGRLLGITIPASAIHPAARPLGYRTRARVHLEAKRGGRVLVGMFGRRSHSPAVVDACVVLDPILDRVRAALPRWLEGAQGSGEAHLALGMPGPVRRAVVDLRFVRGGEALPGSVFGRLEAAIAEPDGEGALAILGGVRIFAGDVTRPATIGDPTPGIIGPDGEPLALPPGGFSQATEEQNRVLASRVLEQTRALPPGPCVELYAGAGNLTVLLAREREVTSVESDAAACSHARENLGHRGLRAKVVSADAGTFVIPKPTRLVVLDPPREGARTVAEALAARRSSPGGARSAPSVAYVSCDPPTLARDVRILADAGYVLRSVETFEMFPQTSHVETLAILTPEPGPG